MSSSISFITTFFPVSTNSLVSIFQSLRNRSDEDEAAEVHAATGGEGEKNVSLTLLRRTFPNVMMEGEAEEIMMAQECTPR